MFSASDAPGGEVSTTADLAISFVMPAYNAEDTLARAMGSVLAQSIASWELIVVVDGAVDGTAATARHLAAGDPRIRIVEQAQAGPAAARNTGLAMATAAWVVFIDSDDTIEPRYAATMLAAAAQGDVDCLVAGFTRRNERGEEIGRIKAPDIAEDPLGCCEAGPPAAIHCFMTRHEILNRIGGFDPVLMVGEDWDLWLRLASAEARFASVPHLLAHYWARAESLSSDGPLMLTNFRHVLEKAQAQNAEGALDTQAVADLLLASCFWSAGVALGRGESTDGLASFVPEIADWRFQPLHLATLFIDGLVIGSGQPWPAQYQRWPRHVAGVEALLDELADRLGAGFDGFAIRQKIEAELLRAGHYQGPQPFATATGVPITLSTVVRGFDAEQSPDMVVVRMRWLKPSTMFSFSVPTFGKLSGTDLIRTVRDVSLRRLASAVDQRPKAASMTARGRRAEAIARRLIKRPRAASAGFAVPASTQAFAADRACDIAAEAAMQAVPVALQGADEPEHPQIGADAADWEAFFATEDPWGYGSAYEQRKYDETLAMIVAGLTGKARHGLEIACAEGRFTALLAPHTERLTALDISTTAIDRAARRTAAFPHVDYAQRDVFRDGIEGSYDLITCSEVLYYMADVPALQRLAGQVAAALELGGLFVHAHAFELSDTPDRTAFDWDDSFGAQTIFESFRDAPGLRHLRTLETDLYRIDLFVRSDDVAPVPEIEVQPLPTALEDNVAGSVVWNGAIRTRASVAGDRVFRLPVLMYHRIASDGPTALAPYRIDPLSFERQLRYLRRRGFRSVTLEEWQEGATMGGSLKGRPVMLSFDDAYQDFADVAWPIIKRNGFGAHMFVPTGKLGATSDWDARYGEPAPLMSWETLATLVSDGLTVGSHLQTHTPATLLPGRALLDEAIRSRMQLERLAGGPVTSVAPPYGNSDDRVEQVLAAAGYTRSFRADGGTAPIVGLDMRIPRVGVYADMDMAAFAEAVGTADEPADIGDEP